MPLRVPSPTCQCIRSLNIPSQVAPFAAARRNCFLWYGYSGIVNILDYTACTLPVTTVDKSIDVADSSFKSLSDLDKSVMDTCE